MKNGFHIVIILIVFSMASCAKIDRIPPEINSLKINGIEVSDTTYLGSGTFIVNYMISDKELVQSCKFNLKEQVNHDSAFSYLLIKEINSNQFIDEVTMYVPDSVKLNSKFFSLTLNAFDNSGNQAKQRKTIINFK